MILAMETHDNIIMRTIEPVAPSEQRVGRHQPAERVATDTDLPLARLDAREPCADCRQDRLEHKVQQLSSKHMSEKAHTNTHIMQKRR